MIKVLGVSLDNKLNFNIHIENICKQASGQINALRRISRDLSDSNRILTYKSFILSNFSYSPVTWIFCGKKNATKLEKLQERALRFVYKDSSSSYDVLLKRENFLPLSIYRIKFLAIEMYKCVNSSNPSYLNELFHLKNLPYNLRDQSILKQGEFKGYTYGYKSFTYYGLKLWNNVPNEIKSSNSLYTFKRKISFWCLSDKCRSLEIF